MSKTRHHALVLLPRCSLLALAAAQEAFDAANEWLEDGSRHQVWLLSLDGRPVVTGGGALVSVQGAVAAVALAGPPDNAPLPPPLFSSVQIHADQPHPSAGDAQAQALQHWLRQHASAGAVLAGIGSGAALLAAAGLLDGHRATLHWAFVPELAAAHPAVVFSNNVYEIDRQRLSCGGGTAALDLTIAWLADLHGEGLAQALIAHFGLERLRARDERQRVPLAARLGGGNAKLEEAVALMEANLGEPLPTEDIARLVGVSRRQLERLFKQHLAELPSRYYGELRLARAQKLLRQSSQSVLQVGLACGFTSGSHFSNAYRARFGRTPREERGNFLLPRAPAAPHQIEDSPA